MVASAKALALHLSRNAMDCEPHGVVTRVTNSASQVALGRAFERMFLARGEVQVMRLSDSTARGFPHGNAPPEVSATAWLAVGINTTGVACYAMRWICLPEANPMVQRAFVESLMGKELEIESAKAGFPATMRNDCGS